ncbi:MAG: helix-turn-helix domain-containing protein [Beijerinckiaceae bacterium]
MKRGPNNVDVNVGARVRTRRLAVGLTQDKLAKAVGITFQQIQKYEKGVNRIGAGRLQDISRVLGAPVSFFYADLPDVMNERVREARPDERPPAPKAPEPSEQSAEALRLIKGFLKIKDPEVRRHVMALVEALSRQAPK